MGERPNRNAWVSNSIITVCGAVKKEIGETIAAPDGMQKLLLSEISLKSGE